MARFLLCMLAFLLVPMAHGEEPAAGARKKVVVIPVRTEIGEPILYIIRRGVKEAIEDKVDTLVLDMETPGGALDSTFEILKVLEKFPGKVITYVDREAISAGALIASGTDEIYFSPGGVIGAAAPVLSTGGDLDETMHQKIVSYLKARVRSLSEGKGYRGDVISAMIDEDFEFKIGEKVIKKKGELLSLTAQEAVEPVGDPPQPLLGVAIEPDMTALLDRVHGKGNYTVERLAVTWSEQLAQYLTMAAPVLMGLGMLALFIEFKTPGFGVFGITGIVLMVVVFFGHNVAGLSGAEALIVFLLGLCLVGVEIFFFPGTVVLALLGAVMMLGSLVWAMVDHWPGEPISFSQDVLMKPLANVVGGIAMAVLAFLALLKFLPKGGPFGGMVLEAAIAGKSGTVGPVHGRASGAGNDNLQALIGAQAVAATPMMPSGQVEIGGVRYEARLDVGSVGKGAELRVVRVSEFGLTVEEVAS